LPELLVSLKQRLKDLEMTSDLEALAKQEQSARSSYDRLAAKLSAERGKAAAKLSREVNAAMKELAMSGGRFEVELRSLLPDGSVSGNEQVEFLVSTDPGTEVRARQSGIRRRAVAHQPAIQVTTERQRQFLTLIFDEVDAGIGGAVAGSSAE
jgi:DNA repair protein RecN (Recombination protein N)